MGIRKVRQYVPLLRDCCGKPPKWEGTGPDSRVKCPTCGREGSPNVKRGAAARSWNFSLKRGSYCAKGHPNPTWVPDPKSGYKRCKDCWTSRHLHPVPIDPTVTATTMARIGYALDAALRAAKVGITDAMLLSGIRTIGRIRNGEDNPTVETLARIADSIGMDMWVTFVGRQPRKLSEATSPTTLQLERPSNSGEAGVPETKPGLLPSSGQMPTRATFSSEEGMD